MPNDTNTMGTNSSGFYINHTTDGSGDNFKVLLKTENTFVDQDIAITVNTPAAGTIDFAADDISSGISMGTASNGVYSPTATITGDVSFATAGWTTAGPHSVSDTGVKIGTVNQSTLSKDGSTIASGSTIVPTDSAQVISISEGYNSARTLTVGAADAGAGGQVKSGSATVSSVSYTYNSTNGNFTVGGSANVSAPSVVTPGYISTTKGTLTGNTNGVIVSATTAKVGVSAALSGTTSITPTISKNAIEEKYQYLYNAALSTDAINTAPTDGTAASRKAYVAVKVNSATTSITATPSVTTTGYGTTTSGQYTVDASDTETITASNDAIYYIRIKQGSITSGSATIDTVSITYDGTNSNYTVSGSADVSKPTYTEGYIASYLGGKSINADGAVVATTISPIEITGSLSYSSGSTGLKTPSISKDSNTNIAGAGTATTTKPSSGYYVAVKSAKSSVNITAVPTVTTAGYGDTTSGHYTANNSSAVEVGAAASSVTYIPITAATFANSATSGTTYTDISSSAPALISGDYLYINAGYTPAQKISLAKLIPDATNTNASAAYILSGYTAYDNDGALLVGTMQTYDGTYEVV